MLLALVLSSTAPATGEMWRSANATFYNGWTSGACGYKGLVDSPPYSSHVAAVSEAIWNGGGVCGSCVEVRCVEPGRCRKPAVPVTVLISDLCPSAGNERWCSKPSRHLDLSSVTFPKIADPVLGHVVIQYRSVPCPSSGALRVSIDSGNPFYMALTIMGLPGRGGDLDALGVFLVGQGQVLTLKRSWGAIFSVSGTFLRPPFALRLRRRRFHTQTTPCIPKGWTPGKTYECRI